MDRIRELEDELEDLQEKMRDKDQLIANQNAEITALRRKMVQYTEALDDFVDSEIRIRSQLEEARKLIQEIFQT